MSREIQALKWAVKTLESVETLMSVAEELLEDAREQPVTQRRDDLVDVEHVENLREALAELGRAFGRPRGVDPDP
jgi:ribosomal protein L17